MIELKFFASLREQLGSSGTTLEYSGQEDIAEVITSLINQDKRYVALNEQDVLSARNHTLCGKDEAVSDGDELAFFPPVTGG